ncbi:MAG: S41 family peptidase [Lentisphaerae bacterium]|nr:S41 family peptidase [Lentisphaerota bacterium]
MKTLIKRIALIGVVFLLGINLVIGAKLAVRSDTDALDDAFRKMQLLSSVLLKIRDAYVDEDKVDYQTLINGALSGMLQSLDPHSSFLDEDKYKNMLEDTAGEFGGLGMTVGIRNNMLTVIAPIEESPALRAGIRGGDKIIEIMDEPTDNMSLDEAVKLLKGEPNTKVIITIMRSNPHEIKRLELVRDIISVPSVKDVIMLDGTIGYLRVTQFNDQTPQALREGIKKLQKQGMTAMVLDLRDNPGGLLNVAVDMGSLFLPRDTLVVTVRSRDQKDQVFPAKGFRHYPYFPLVLLVNGSSASASEIVAGALQDHKRAVVIGENTYGKGSVQSIIKLDDGSAIRLTTAKYYTPSGRLIHEKGIEPDIEVVIPPEQWQKIVFKRSGWSDEDSNSHELEERDIQLERAIDVLKGVMVFKGTLDSSAKK